MIATLRLNDQARQNPARLAALRGTGLLDTDIEEAFDRITRLAVRLVEIPAAFVSLVDENRDFYKSTCGFGDALPTRELAGPTFCHFTIRSDGPLVIPDTVADERYRDVPTVRSLGVAAYVGVPLVVSGQVIGALCAIDKVPRAWTDRDVTTLTDLATIAVSEIELRAAHVQSQRASAALAASEVRYRTLTEAVPVQVWTATPDGKLDFVSARGLAYFAVPVDQVLGAGWSTFVHPDDLPEAAREWSEALTTGHPYEVEFRLRHGRTGDYRWHLVRALPEHGPDGSITGWIGSNTDVETERSARADAEEANRAKSEFLAAMSHELRTPLNAIGGYAELIETGVRGPVTAAQSLDLERIQRSQRHLLSLINGILDYARVDAGMMPFATEDVPMDEVLAACEALTMPQFAAAGLSFVFPRTKTLLVALADREKTQQILLNLLSNAIKFTADGGRVELTCVAEAERIVVRVTDSGRGIPADQLERVFQPFVQVDARLTRGHGGTGLGLAISRDFARGMGGDLVAISDQGKGSTFVLTLPSSPASGQPTRRLANASSRAATEAQMPSP